MRQGSAAPLANAQAPRAPATETDVTVAAALARGGWLAESYVPKGERLSLKIATYQKEN